MSDALNKALADASRSYHCAKAAVQSSGDAVFATTRAGGQPFMERRADGRAQEQLTHFHGWVFACVHAIASRIAGQKVNVGQPQRVRPTKAATLTPLQTHPLLNLLNDPNDLQIAWSLWYFTVASLELTGRCLWWQTEVDDREVLIPIPTSWLTGFNGGASSFTEFSIRPPWGSIDQQEYTIPADEAVFFFYPHPSGLRDWASPLQAAAAAVDADEQIQVSQVAAFRNGLFPRHALIVGDNPTGNGTAGGRPRLTGAQRKQVVRAIRQVYAGTMNSGEPLILDGLIQDIKNLSMSPAEMDWQASGAITKARILQSFGVNEICIGQVEGANRASSLAAELHMAATLNPKLRLLGDTLTAWLSPRFGGQVKVWFDPYRPDDAEMQFKYRQLLIQAGACTKDEMRGWAGEPPLPHNVGTLLLGETESGGSLERALNRHIESVASAMAGDYVRMAIADERHRDRRERINGNGHKHS